MTDFEKQQPEGVFVQAGRDAFRLGVSVYANPYREQPFHKLWEKGWRSAKKRSSNERQVRYA
jgi:hypothetical protein